jgi:hypothetical protein
MVSLVVRKMHVVGPGIGFHPMKLTKAVVGVAQVRDMAMGNDVVEIARYRVFSGVHDKTL